MDDRNDSKKRKRNEDLSPEDLERRRRRDRDRQRRCYERRIEREQGKPFEECDRRRGPRPSGKTQTYGQRRALAHRLAYEQHKRECTKIDCTICSIVFAPKCPKNTDDSELLDAVLDAPTPVVAVKNV